MKERVQKLMAQANIGSRRACEAIIQQGRVRVNGQAIKLGDQADPQTDVIEVDGSKLSFPKSHTYIAYNKPKNVVSSNVRYQGDDRPTVREMIPVEGHLFTIGRLDADSEGLIILTNDGDLANRLSHPRYHHTKTYKVVVYGLPSQEIIERWQEGVFLQDEEDEKPEKTAPCYVKIVDGGKETTLRIIMTEGKKRQIRRVASLLGHPVKSLVRTHIGKLPLGALRLGEWRELNASDIAALKTPADELHAPKSRLSRSPRPYREQTTPSSGEPGRAPKSRPSRSPRPARLQKTSTTRDDKRATPARRNPRKRTK